MDNSLDKPIVVPWDYSDKAECALIHAIDFSKILGKEIVLVHIVKKESEVAVNVEKLTIKTEEIYQKYGVRPQIIVKQGNIFSEIKAVMNDCDALMAIMGTHGMKGFQKFTGSWRKPSGTIRSSLFPRQWNSKNWKN